VTKILGGDSFTHKQKSQNQLRVAVMSRSAVRVRHDGDSAGDPRTRLGNCFLVHAMCCCCFFFFTMNDTLFKSFSMHLHILSYMV